MTLKTHLRENFYLAYPVMLSNLGHVTMGVSDNVMVGHLGASSLAAAGLALVAFNVLMLFGIGVSYAITPLVATAHGEGNDEAVAQTLKHGLIINVITGVCLVGVVYAARNILYYIDQPEDVVDLAIPYLGIITVSIIPMLIFQTYKQFAEGLSNTKVAMIIILFANVVNIALNYSLIYGHAGMPALGLRGAGWATLLSRIFMALAIAGYIYYSPTFHKYRAGFSFGNYARSLFKKMLNIGIPSGAQFIFEVAAFDFSLVMIGWLGTTTQAAHQITINMATVTYMTTAGLAAAATVRVSYFLGNKDIRNLKLAAYSLLGMAMALMGCCAVIFIAGRHTLPHLYIDDAEVISIASNLLIIAALFQFSDGAQVVCASALRGLQDVKIPSVLIFICYWVISLPLGYVLAFNIGLGAIGIWLGLLIGLTLTAIAMFVRFKMLVKTLSMVNADV
ncbi:MATE family efflux transporter [Chryseolinea sp. H1M3-3]|uniref:MATE family efflux transporter n=1 Tax=Chryseolinea sp. H1M3-3 TaxID=3034144 RepID=UPI0023EE0BE0|nr:MATE family efflux transporter [Chryseolinea sp. H1M3-3]